MRSKKAGTFANYICRPAIRAIQRLLSSQDERRVTRTNKTERTVEIHELYVIRQTSGAFPSLCSDCATGAGLLVTPEQATAIAGVSVQMIYRWVETEMIHYRRGPDGSLRVCVKSLPITSNSE